MNAQVAMSHYTKYVFPVRLVMNIFAQYDFSWIAIIGFGRCNLALATFRKFDFFSSAGRPAGMVKRQRKAVNKNYVTAFRVFISVLNYRPLHVAGFDNYRRYRIADTIAWVWRQSNLVCCRRVFEEGLHCLSKCFENFVCTQF